MDRGNPPKKGCHQRPSKRCHALARKDWGEDAIRSVVGWLWGFVWLVASGCLATAAHGQQRYEFVQPKMGSEFKLVFYAPDEETANRAAEAAFETVDRLEEIFSDYEPDSEVSLLSQSAPTPKPIKLSDPLWAVLQRSQSLSKASSGAFDVTVGPLVRLWRQARRTHELPAPEQLAEAKQAVGYELLELDPRERTARLRRPRMLLDLGGIAMGYTVDAAMKVLAQHGIERAMIDGSGDIAVSQPPPDKAGWTIGIGPPAPSAPPSRYLTLANCAITASGDALQSVEVGGRRYSHIVDPHTGLGLTESATVNVIAPDCLTADSLATAVSVLGAERGLALVAKTPGAEAIIQRDVDGKLQTRESPGFSRYERPTPAAKN